MATETVYDQILYKEDLSYLKKNRDPIIKWTLFVFASIATIFVFLIIIFNGISFSQDYKVYQKIEFESINKVLMITADNTTYNENFGDTYRVLRLFLKSQDNNLIETDKHILKG